MYDYCTHVRLVHTKRSGENQAQESGSLVERGTGRPLVRDKGLAHPHKHT